MAKRTFLAGVTSQSIDIFVGDAASVIGAGLAGLAFGTSGLLAYYRIGPAGAATQITLVTQTVAGAWVSGGFKEIDATNMKGVYRLDLPNAVLASSPYAVVYLFGATNMVPVVAELEIVAYNPFDATRLGLAALPATTQLAKTVPTIGRGTVDAGASTTSIPTSAFSPAGAVADQFKDRVMIFDADTATTALRGQAKTITASTNAAAPTFTVSALTTAPASGDTFSVV